MKSGSCRCRARTSKTPTVRTPSCAPPGAVRSRRRLPAEVPGALEEPGGGWSGAADSGGLRQPECRIGDRDNWPRSWPTSPENASEMLDALAAEKSVEAASRQRRVALCDRRPGRRPPVDGRSRLAAVSPRRARPCSNTTIRSCAASPHGLWLPSEMPIKADANPKPTRLHGWRNASR